ncbi:hypothetical protein [Natrarchaeobaculum sulfurireducens]|uniref:Histidine kinase n=1 Tax=Natrarchaeobaculum sulfurireducens TaxID=2044521 RepID=A0A346PAK1_9EURY|nr:hypothetical protein [Natrarchaeobaculum sulfurireducens]AXR76546.1 hypothetical protein AArc1_0202 [Natrarchaeobaculum sulfurireducens]
MVDGITGEGFNCRPGTATGKSVDDRVDPSSSWVDDRKPEVFRGIRRTATMSNELATPTEYGFGGSLNWLIGGAVGGVVGSALFGLVLWLVDPAVVTDAIPAIYGLEPGTIGWGFHLVHGLVLGIVFGVLVTRDVIFGTITAGVATDAIDELGLGTRLALAGMVYGLAVWAILPLIGQSIAFTVGGDPSFPVAAFESLLGHLVYGLLLGALFSVFVEVAPEAEAADAPFEEDPDTETDP